MRSNRIFILALLFALWNSSLYAADYYVSPNGGTGSGGINDPWSLAYANAQLKAGDRAFLRAGTYLDQIIKPVNSGVSGNPITYVAASGENPEFRGSTSIAVLVDLKGRSYITVDGVSADGEKIFKESRFKKWINFENSNNCVVKNSNFYRAEGWEAISIVNSSYNKLINNVVDTVGTWDIHPWEGVHDDSGTMFKLQNGSSYNLIEGNTFRRSGHDMGGLKNGAGSYNIIRKNSFDNDWGVYQGTAFTFKQGNIAAGDKVGNRTLEIKGGRYTLVENNIFMNVGESVDNSNVAMIKANGIKTIVRNNLFMNGNRDGIYTHTDSSAPKSEFNRIFHNVFYNLGGPAWKVEAIKDTQWSPNNNEFKNNVVYKAHTNPAESYLDVDIGFERLKEVWNNSFLDNKVVNNCFAFDDSLSKQQVYNDASGKLSLTEMESRYPAYFNNNIQAKPSFVNSQPQSSIDDYRLSSSSECRNAGGNLTLTTNSGTGKTIRVGDVAYFSDGRGLISGDLIKVGPNAAVRVTKVNYSTNELTLESSITWSKNDGVNLNYSGTKPDIGLVKGSESVVVAGAGAGTLLPPSNIQLILR